MRFQRTAFTILLSIAWLAEAKTFPDLKFGPELTFKPDGNPDETPFSLEDQRKVAEDLAQTLEQRCKQAPPTERCKVQRVPGAATYHATMVEVSYPDGFQFKLTQDADVIEVKVSPQTVEGYEKLGARMQQDIFNLMAEHPLRLKPHRYEGAGHIHVDFEGVFDQDPFLFRNFLVDTVNHFELGDGVLGDNRTDGYGPTLAFQGAWGINRFREVIADFDAGKLKTAQELALAVVQRVYGWNNHYQAINLNRPAKVSERPGHTLELRFLRPQRNVEDLQKLTRLFRARIEYLSRQRNTIPLRNDFKEETTSEEGILALRQYVKQSGLNWKPYRDLLIEPHQSLARKRKLRTRCAPSAARLTDAEPQVLDFVAVLSNQFLKFSCAEFNDPSRHDTYKRLRSAGKRRDSSFASSPPSTSSSQVWNGATLTPKPMRRNSLSTG